MNKPTVLIVDDERFFISLLTSILTPEYSILSATNGDDCLEIVKQQTVDLILLDIIMPGLDGFAVCKSLKENQKISHIPVIFLTIKNDIDDEVKGFELGAVDYLTKPISPSIVRARVETHISLQRAQQELRTYNIELENLVAERTVELSREIAKTQKAFENLHYLANYDQLTQLPNRNLFNERLSYACKQAQRRQAIFTLMLIDLDRFKQVNDVFGHHVGDQLLAQVGNRLVDCLRGVDTVARLGGDEFTILLTDIDNKNAATYVAEKIIGQLEEPFQLDNHLVFVTASIGIAFFPTDTEEMESMLKLADMAMYRAKDQGKNTYNFYASHLTEYANRRMELEKDLHNAIKNDELFLHYQPIYDTQTQSIKGVEALLRWHSPRHGLVSPEKIISIAEESDLILIIGNWVLMTACKQFKSWRIAQEIEGLYIAVNVSARQFSDKAGSIGDIESTLEELDFPYNALVLEITEHLLLEQSYRINEKLLQLKALGIRLSIDDFGTGYSSLSYLRQFPVDGIKIDRSFIQDLQSDSDDAVLVKAVLAMGHSLNLNIVAEGVETKEHYDFLKAHGCDSVQGYYFSKAISAEGFEQLLLDDCVRDHGLVENFPGRA